MRTFRVSTPVAAFLLLVFGSVANAHPGHTGGDSWLVHGLTHPFSGFDHAVMAAAIGVLSWISGSRRAILLPTLFLSGMLVGLLAPWFGIEGTTKLPFFETVMAATVLSIGWFVYRARQDVNSFMSVLIVVCGLFHGLAHGAADVALSERSTWGIGILLGTATLHGIGIGLGMGTRFVPRQAHSLRWIGAMTMAFGLACVMESVM